MSEGSKAKEAGTSRWDDGTLRSFYQAFHSMGQNWPKVAAAVGHGKTPEQCEALWKQHQTFLAIPSQPALQTAFIAMVKDHYNNLLKEAASQQAQQGIDASTGSAGAKPESAAENGKLDHANSEAELVNGSMAAQPAAGDLNGADVGVASAGGSDGDDEGASALPAETAAGRPVRSTRGKPPRPHSPGDDELPRQRGGTPGRSRGHVTPGSAKKSKAVDGGARKRGGRKLFGDDIDVDMQPVDELGEEVMDSKAYMQRWKGKGPQQRDAAFEHGVDALLQLAMATSLDAVEPSAAVNEDDQHMVEADAMAEGAQDMDAGFASPGALDRPGKRKVRPPTRLDDSYASPVKQIASTPRKARAGSQTPTMLAAPALPPGRSPRAVTPRGGWPGQPRSAKGKKRGREPAFDEDTEGLEGEGYDEGFGEEVQEDQPPRAITARQRAKAERQAQMAREASQPPATQEDVVMEEEGQAEAYDEAEEDPNNMPGMAMGALHLPGLPGVPSNLANFNFGTASTSMAVQALGTAAANGDQSFHGAIISHRTRPRKPMPERSAAANQPTAAQQQQQQLLRSVLGMGSLGMPQETIAPPAPAPPTIESALTHALASHKVRRWARCEWHYSAIDRPFFMRSELTDLLTSIGLQHVHKLTRGEWNLLRGSFGKARRLSLSFLREERMKLEGYRMHVRKAYEDAGLGAEVSPELPKQLRVGQEVIAIHRPSRALHDGVILTIKSSNYRVQYHRADLMTEVVPDVDVMPCDPRENLPQLLSQSRTMMNGRSAATLANGPARAKTRVAPTAAAVRATLQQQTLAAAVPAGMVPVNAGTAADEVETDAAIVQEMAQKLELKEQLTSQLRDMNAEAEAGVHQDRTGRHTEHFQARYTQVVLQLKELNSAIDSLYQRLQQRSQVAALAMLQSGAGIAPTPTAALSGTGGAAAGGAIGSSSAAATAAASSATAAGATGVPTPSATPGIAPNTAAASLAGLVEGLGLQGGGYVPGFGSLGITMPTGNLILPPPNNPAELAAQQVLSAAYHDAKTVVDRYSSTRKASAASAAGASADGTAGAGLGQSSKAAAAQGEGNAELPGGVPGADTAETHQQLMAAAAPNLEKLVTCCLTVLCTVQRSIADNIPTAAIDHALELAVQSLQQADVNGAGVAAGAGASGTGEGGQRGTPPAADVSGVGGSPNATLYAHIAESIRELKSQLVKAA